MVDSILESGAREDLVAAHAEVMASLAEPGSWWNSPQRLAIAGEVRRAMANAHLRPWEAPSSIDGMVEADHPLPHAAVDAIWRLTNHPGTLTHEWYQTIVAALPAPEDYVELVSVVALVNAVDRLALALGLDVIALPAPGSREPARAHVDGVTVSTHWVPTADMSGPNVLKALSAVPSEQGVRDTLSNAQYVPAAALLGDLEWHRGTLDRRQIELIAAQTSLLNECFY